jgi:hypothetical protein
MGRKVGSFLLHSEHFKLLWFQRTLLLKKVRFLNGRQSQGKGLVWMFSFVFICTTPTLGWIWDCWIYRYTFTIVEIQYDLKNLTIFRWKSWILFVIKPFSLSTSDIISKPHWTKLCWRLKACEYFVCNKKYQIFEIHMWNVILFKFNSKLIHGVKKNWP